MEREGRERPSFTLTKASGRREREARKAARRKRVGRGRKAKRSRSSPPVREPRVSKAWWMEKAFTFFSL